jgi:iron complex transport system substrate-binding protein
VVRGALAARIDNIASRARALPACRAVTMEWMDPPMVGGTWMHELISLAAGVPLGTRPGIPSPTLTLGQLTALAPEVVMVKPCGMSLERALRERELLDAIARATAPARVYVTDGSAYFNRPGPRLVESLEILAACFHPEAFADLAEAHAADVVRLA